MPFGGPFGCFGFAADLYLTWSNTNDLEQFVEDYYANRVEEEKRGMEWKRLTYRARATRVGSFAG